MGLWLRAAQGCVARAQHVWCGSAAVGTESVALVKWPQAALMSAATSFPGALLLFGPSRTELFKSTSDLSVA